MQILRNRLLTSSGRDAVKAALDKARAKARNIFDEADKHVESYSLGWHNGYSAALVSLLEDAE